MYILSKYTYTPKKPILYIYSNRNICARTNTLIEIRTYTRANSFKACFNVPIFSYTQLWMMIKHSHIYRTVRITSSTTPVDSTKHTHTHAHEDGTIYIQIMIYVTLNPFEHHFQNELNWTEWNPKRKDEQATEIEEMGEKETKLNWTELN